MISKATELLNSKQVCKDMIFRSKKYLEALLASPRVFASGLGFIAHNGSHNYYQCVLKLPSDELVKLSAVEDVATRSDESWKTILKN